MTLVEQARAFLGKDFKKYRHVLSVAVNSSEGYIKNINSYVLEHRGKELRPILSLLIGRACGTLTPLSYYCAAVVEMLHSASLMHDDVADDASLRRSVPSLGARFSPATAILAGDFWLSCALHMITTKCDADTLSCFTDAVRKLSEGELVQMSRAESLKTTERDYFGIIEKKTASLFIACARSAAHAAGALPPMVEVVAKYAKHLGIAFQIRDDIFDYTPEIDAGKETGGDLRERKITLPLLGAFKNNREGEAHIRELLSKIKITKRHHTPRTKEEKAVIEEITSFVADNGGIDYAQKKLCTHGQRAIRELSLLPASPEKDFLISFAEDAGNRLR